MPIIGRVLEWMRAGYPEGVPQGDYVALLGILHRQLTEDEVNTIVEELAAHAEPGHVITADEIRDMIKEKVIETAEPEDVARVSQRLEAVGWTTEDIPDPSTVPDHG